MTSILSRGTRILGPILLVMLVLAVLNPAAAAGENVLWQKTWGTGGFDYGNAVAVGSDGGIFVVGGSSVLGVVILKYASDGSLLWQERWGNGSANAVAADASGGVYVAGYTLNATRGEFDALLLHLSSTGGVLWQKTWGMNGGDIAMGIAVDSSGSIYAEGDATGNDMNSRGAFLLRFDSAGGLLWERTWNMCCEAPGVAVDSLGNAYVVGAANSSGSGNQVFADLFLLKLNSSGSVLWGRAWGGINGYDSGKGVAVDATGNVYVVGDTNRFGAGSLGDCSLTQKCDNVLLLKFNSTGNLLWQRTWGGLTGEHAYGVAVDTYGGVYATGTTSSFTSTPDAFLLKLDESGNGLFAEAWGGKNAGGGLGVATDSLNNTYVTGYVAGPPPYPAVAINSTLETSSGNAVPISNTTLGMPTIPIAIPTGNVSTLHGSQTYSGGLDMLLFKYGYGKGVPISSTVILVTLVLASTAPLALSKRKSKRW